MSSTKHLRPSALPEVLVCELVVAPTVGQDTIWWYLTVDELSERQSMHIEQPHCILRESHLGYRSRAPELQVITLSIRTYLGFEAMIQMYDWLSMLGAFCAAQIHFRPVA